MKFKNLFKFLLVILFAVITSNSWAANTIKWSMKGDSLTIDPNAQNEGPTTRVSRQV